MKKQPPEAPPEVAESAPLVIERWPISRLTPDPHNVNDHSSRSIESIANSLRIAGQQKPIVVTAEGIVVAGNGFVEAAKTLGWEHVDVVVTKLSGSALRAFAIADNRTARLSSFREVELYEALKALEQDDVKPEVVGFNAIELRQLSRIAEARVLGAAAEDVAASKEVEHDLEVLREKWDVRPGDVWKLGAHRVACGDSRDRVLIDRLLASSPVSPILMVTDPPYGVKYNPMWRSLRTPTMKHTIPLKMTKSVQNDEIADWREAIRLFPGDVAYVWHSGLMGGVVTEALRDCGFSIRSQIVWEKSTFTLGRGHYDWQHEPCYYAVREGKTASWVGLEHESTVWKIAGFVGFGYVRRDQLPEDEKSGHGTQKPVELWERPMRNHTVEGEAVFDPFLGSGTALLAADRMGRVCLGVELDPVYVALAIERWIRRGNELDSTDAVLRAEAQGEP